jgi:hypothetical protein
MAFQGIPSIAASSTTQLWHIPRLFATNELKEVPWID